MQVDLGVGPFSVSQGIANTIQILLDHQLVNHGGVDLVRDYVGASAMSALDGGCCCFCGCCGLGVLAYRIYDWMLSFFGRSDCQLAEEALHQPVQRQYQLSFPETIDPNLEMELHDSLEDFFRVRAMAILDGLVNAWREEAWSHHHEYVDGKAIYANMEHFKTAVKIYGTCTKNIPRFVEKALADKPAGKSTDDIREEWISACLDEAAADLAIPLDDVTKASRVFSGRIVGQL